MVPRSRRYYEGATTSYWRIGGRLFFFRFHRPRASSYLCVSPWPTSSEVGVALLKGWRSPPGPGILVPAARGSGDFTWTPVGSLRSLGDPSCAFAPLLDPGRTSVPSPWRSHRYCPTLEQERGLRTMGISGLTHAALAPALLRFAFRVATHAQGWLPAGWLAFTGRVSNPLDHYERFQVT
jgi:hypothetical protein